MSSIMYTPPGRKALQWERVEDNQVSECFCIRSTIIIIIIIIIMMMMHASGGDGDWSLTCRCGIES